ncbi:MAG: phosphotransferase, partial [Desulfovibrionaceae bacterium]|nr:phosphotransferase [Desulfovibrionaceae bacterium]
MSQISLNNNQQQILQQPDVNQQNQNIPANNLQPAQVAPQDPNEEALRHLSGSDRAAAEIFLKGTSTQEATKHTKWSLATKIITGIFTFGIAPAIMCRAEAKKEKQLAQDAVKLKDTLNSFEQNKNLKGRTISMDGNPVFISNKNGVLSATINGQTIVSNYNAKTLAEKIEDDIVANTDLYGKKAALDLFHGTKGLYQRSPNAQGHAGKSLIEQFNSKLTKCNERITKAETAVNADPTAKALLTELQESQSKLKQLQAEYERTEIRCNKNLLQCNSKLEDAGKALKTLQAAKAEGGNVDGLIKDAEAKLNSAMTEKGKVEAELLNLRTVKKEALETAEITKNAAFLAAKENNLCKELLDANHARDTLKLDHATTMAKGTERLQELQTSPNRDTPAVQAEISALKTVLAAPENSQNVDARELHLNDPMDALDRKGVNDTRHRDLCLKAIKAHLGIDGGELHSCTTRYLDRIAQYAIDGYYGTAKNLIDHVLKIATTNRIAADDVMELMDLRHQDKNVAEKVNVAVLRGEVKPFATATQKQEINFAADLIYSGNIIDEDNFASTERIRNVLRNNAKVIGDIVKVEAGLNAIDLENKAKEAEEKAALPTATEADKLAAKAARAEADAAQLAAQTLRGSLLNKSVNAVSNFFSNLFGQKSIDESQFTNLERIAYQAEADALREELAKRNELTTTLAHAQDEVDNHPDDPARLAALTDAQKAIADFDKGLNPLPTRQEAIEARLAVRLARAEAKAKFTQDPADQKKASDLKAAIEAAKPGVPAATLGSEFDTPASNVIGQRLTDKSQLPESERESLISALPEDMGNGLKDTLVKVQKDLLAENMTANTAAILFGIKDLTDDTLKNTLSQINASVTQAANMVQEEMTTAILMMDTTLGGPSKAVVRELKAVLESENLPLNQENAETVLNRKPLPASLATALDGLANAITGIDNAAQRQRLASKVAGNAFTEYARLAQNAKDAQDNLNNATQNLENAQERKLQCRTDIQRSLGDVTHADEEWHAKENQYSQSQNKATTAETAAHNAEVAAEGIANGFVSIFSEQVREGLRQEEIATDAESRAIPLEEAATQAENQANALLEIAEQAKNTADEAELQTYVAGAPADAEEKARLARKAADDAMAAANNARNKAQEARTRASNVRTEATTARNAANAAFMNVDANVLTEARAARQSMLAAREQATQLREQANAANATALQDRALADAAKQDFDKKMQDHGSIQQALTDAETAVMQAEADKSRAKNAATAALNTANTALGLGQDGQIIQDEAAAPPDAAQNHAQRLEYLNNTSLNSLVAAAGTDFNSDGVGKFIKFVIQDYFQSVPLADKRAMISAGLRYAPANATPMQKLGAMLKGAGPVLQKIFQGLDGPGLPQDLRIACQDMKSRLAPIPPDIVEATLLDMVNSSNGRISKIEVLSSLGAASVGQAFRCRLTDHKGESRECVVKILRPDAANRVKREQPIFENAAAKVPGMSGTFRGQMDGIMEELDFGIEATNAKTGAVYNKPFDGQVKTIQSVQVVEDIPPKSTSMAMEMAPGTTLDGFLRDTREEIERMGQPLGRYETYNDQGQRAKVEYDVPENRMDELKPVKARLQELYDQAQARHKQLTALADVWVTEGIFGEQGFFHGDLHAGNIMSDGTKLTVIDFGNATKLSQEQQSAITTMIVSTSTRQSSKFLDSFRSLLSPEAQTAFDAKKEKIFESVRVIMQKGDLGDTGGRIAAIMSEIQRNGVEIPHAIFNFSSSQIRLQNSINEMITLMNHIGEEMRAIDTLRSYRAQELPIDNAIAQQVKSAMADETQTQQSVLTHLANVREQINDPDSELNKEQEDSVRTALNVSAYIAGFKVNVIEKDPKLAEVWNQNQELLENTAHPNHAEAVQKIITALK